MILLNLFVILSACSSKFLEGYPYLIKIKCGRAHEGVSYIYVIDPFDEKSMLTHRRLIM